MRILLSAFALLLVMTATAPALPPAISPDTVAVLYNTNDDASRDLALYYASRRKIPASNLIGLPLSGADAISREAYNTTLRDPLLKKFTKSRWWVREKNAHGILGPVSQKIRVLACMRGVPFKIQRLPRPAAADGSTPKQPGPNGEQDEAAVDSELTLLGIEGYEIKGPLKNPYYKQNTPLATTRLDGMLLVGRIDGPSDQICRRMIDDAVATEIDGLWGMCYLDLAKKGGGYKIGDDWIETIARQNQELGIPSVIDRNSDTFVTNYPMGDAALYFGWYTTNRNGPFLNPEFKFPRGAVAVHLHSFSAQNLRDGGKKWCGPILQKGAAATLGNVYEPFLTMTHNFDIFHDRLTKGYSLVEAASMALPVTSWQNLVLGDPLYRPYASFTDFQTNDSHREFKALRQAVIQWPADKETRTTKLRSAAARLKSGRIYEAIGLDLHFQNQRDQAAAFFSSAAKIYLTPSDKLRQELHLIDMARQAGRKQDAVNRLRSIEQEYAAIPESKAITGLLNILDPPPPPPVSVDKDGKIVKPGSKTTTKN